MTKKAGVKGSLYAILAVSAGMALVLLVVFLIKLTTNPNVVKMIADDFQEFAFPVIAGILSIFLSAYYLGKIAGVKIGRNNKAQSSIGFIAALKILTVFSLIVSIAVVIQISWLSGFDAYLSFYFLLRIAVPIFLLGLPLALLLGYGFEYLLSNKLKKS
ncbi:hypothetical protein [Hymenobacter sp. BT730]|uniref:hypothetical protein n=1 Tax=Hymenobacter sp. BT730 TaxID=3063332 RepID=UPI0026E065C6|nr:hypothetical protein [Hymenobacter sp. BT730]